MRPFADRLNEIGSGAEVITEPTGALRMSYAANEGGRTKNFGQESWEFQVSYDDRSAVYL